MAPALHADALADHTTSSSFGSVQSDKFHNLVNELSRILGPSSGLTSDDVDVSQLRSLMEAYNSHEPDWKRYAFADTSRGYTRNLVDEGNGKSNLLVLVWTPGKSSPIHDHADAHCLMKILKGQLRETRFEPPRKGTSAGSSEQTGEDCAVKKLKETIYSEGEVTYMSDELGLHRIGNVSETEVAVSLHLYTPPNAAREGCNIFCERTGKSSHVTQSNFYSVFGRKVESAPVTTV